ncbi:DUF3943 domain-containing protein [endosymbiont of Lamellibrachia barhami]|uniref:DUF3943 domain-containing protein n=1 Tax=endosymbiont of Lamellibrachia barhami TaxID=205975 RepID=UPI0015AD7A18|nr:DUF3943 domain-containing protein [endosymbiont of Lamellibrachia barhami]
MAELEPTEFHPVAQEAIRMIKALSSCLVGLLLSSAAQANSWLPSTPVSFYETSYEMQRFAAALNEESWLANTAEGTEQPISLNERPYGYGRELDDTSPSDWDGIKRDAFYFIGYQATAIAVLYVMPESISQWSDEDKSNYSFSKWWDNVTNPIWDGDHWWINYILHPYWGMAYYTRARERGYDEMSSFWASVAFSSMYEFGLEALFEPVSIQDLIFTPVIGSMLGYYVEGVRTNIKAQRHYSFGDKTLLVLTDPLGAANSIVDGWFSNEVESDLKFRSFVRKNFYTKSEPEAWSDSPYHTERVVGDYLGLEMNLNWR